MYPREEILTNYRRVENMRSLNEIAILGNVGGDPTVRETSAGSVAEFSVATSEKWATGERTDWHRVVAWGKLADIVQNYVKKGGQVYVKGSMRYEEYEKDGVKRTVAKINARDIILLGGRGESGQPTQRRDVDLSQPDDDLPF
jgi:single-strand DNA-binding protein